MSINLHNFNVFFIVYVLFIVLKSCTDGDTQTWTCRYSVILYNASLPFHNNWHDLKMIFIYNDQYWISALVTYFLRHFAVTFTLKLRESLSSQIIESVSCCAENSCNWISLILKWTNQVHWKDSFTNQIWLLHFTVGCRFFFFLKEQCVLRMKIMLWNAVKKNKIN